MLLEFQDTVKQTWSEPGWKEKMDIAEKKISIHKYVSERELKEERDQYVISTPGYTETPNEYDKFDEAIKSVLFNKSNDKSQAFLSLRRYGGLKSWGMINSWYTATSGQGIAENCVQKVEVEPTGLQTPP